MASFFELCVDSIKSCMETFRTAEHSCFRVSLDEQGGLNRVVWVPRGGTFQPPATGRMGSCAFVPDCLCEEDPGPRVQPPVLYQQTLAVHCFITAEDFEAIEALHVDVLRASAKAMKKAALPGAFDYVSENDDRFGHILGGRSAILQTFTWELGIVKRHPKLATLTKQEHECEIDNTLGLP